MATTKHIYVDPTATGSGSGVDWANAYTSIATALLAEDGDITLATGSDEMHHYHCRGGQDVIYGVLDPTYTTNPATGNYVLIEGDYDGSGTFDPTAHYVDVDSTVSGTTRLIRFGAGGVVVKNMQFSKTNNATGLTILYFGYGATALHGDAVLNCYFKGYGSAAVTDEAMQWFDGGDVPGETRGCCVYNTIFDGFYGSYNVDAVTGTYNLVVCQNTCVNGVKFLDSVAPTNEAHIVGNLVAAMTVEGYENNPTTSASSGSNNEWGGSTTPSWITADWDGTYTVYQIFNDPDNGDYSLASGSPAISGSSNAADDYVADTDDAPACDGTSVQTDATGYSRVTNGWDMGAVNYQAAAGDACVAQDIHSGASVDTATLAETSILAAQDVAAGSSVDSPTLSEVSVLTAQDVAAGSEVDLAALGGSVDILTAQDIAAGSEVDPSALDGVIVALTAQDVRAGSRVEKGWLREVYGLGAQDVATGSSVDGPEIAESSATVDGLIAQGVSAGASVESPYLSSNSTGSRFTAPILEGSPERTSYRVATADDLLRTRLDGGASWTRRRLDGTRMVAYGAMMFRVHTRWVTKDYYQWRHWEDYFTRGVPFKARLVTDYSTDPDVNPPGYYHHCWVVPGTLRMSDPSSGFVFVAEVDLIAVPSSQLEPAGGA